MFLYCWNVCKKTKYKAGTSSEQTATNMREVSVMCPLWHHRRRRTHRSTGVEYFFFPVLLIVPLGPTFLSNVGMEGNERTRVHVGCANHVYHPHSKESHIWNCVQKADKSVLVAAKWWARVFFWRAKFSGWRQEVLCVCSFPSAEGNREYWGLNES